MSSGSTSLSEPKLTQIYVTIWRHYAAMLYESRLWGMYTGRYILLEYPWTDGILRSVRALWFLAEINMGDKTFDWSRLNSSLKFYLLLLRRIFISILIYGQGAGDQIQNSITEGKYAEDTTTTKSARFFDMAWFYAISYFDLWYRRPFDEIITVD